MVLMLIWTYNNDNILMDNLGLSNLLFVVQDGHTENTLGSVLFPLVECNLKSWIL